MKETLYLLPGLLCDRGLWQHQIDVLSSNYNVVVADFSSGSSIEEFCDIVLTDAPERFSVAGLSMGGYVVFELLRRVPKRIERVALIDTSPYADLIEHAEFRKSMIELVGKYGLGAVQETLIPRLIHPSRFGDDDLIRAIDAMAHRVGQDVFIQQQTALLNRRDSYERLGDIKCPCVVIVGRQDAMTPPSVSAKMVAKIPNSSLVEIENCGHMSTMEQPEAVTAVLRYWMQTKNREN